MPLLPPKIPCTTSESWCVWCKRMMPFHLYPGTYPFINKSVTTPWTHISRCWVSYLPLPSSSTKVSPTLTQEQRRCMKKNHQQALSIHCGRNWRDIEALQNLILLIRRSVLVLPVCTVCTYQQVINVLGLAQEERVFTSFGFYVVVGKSGPK